MSKKELIREFLSQRSLALVGLSRNRGKFGNIIYRDLKAKGYAAYPVHREASEIDGTRCWPSLDAIPEKVGGAIIVVPPAETGKVVREARNAGIRRIWMQQGAESEEAIRFCEEQKMDAVHGECILMFVEPASFIHRFHRGLRRLFGKLPR